MTANSFRPAWWLPGAHLQTVWGRLARPHHLVSFRREVLETPDGDELVLDHLDGPLSDAGPHLIVLHGLEGSSYSVYVQGLLVHAAARGWPATAVNFRSCARDPQRITTMLPNRRPRLYHSGETTDFGFVLETLAARAPGVPLVAVGVSLGGNALLKWLGEHPAQRQVMAAATISVPYDLAAGARNLERGIGRFYVRRFLGTLCPKAVDLARRFPEAAQRIDVERALRSRTFWEFDDAVTAPLHGFAGADDYYTRSSSIGFVGRIHTPVLCVSAEDDPFLPSIVLSRLREASSDAVELCRTQNGGHVGFVSGPAPWKYRAWAEEFVVDWLGNAWIQRPGGRAAVASVVR
ncbi:MAG: YheT family hydrolase [Gammaproteobacteria bacterium]